MVINHRHLNEVAPLVPNVAVAIKNYVCSLGKMDLDRDVHVNYVSL